MNKKTSYYRELYVTRSFYRDLYGCYSNPSDAKRRIWLRIQDDCFHLHGCNLTVLTYNAQMFTAAFEYADPETGELRLMVYTPSSTFSVPF